MYVFSERLKDLRIESGYKQDEIAKALNVTTSAYGYYEQGRNEPPLQTINKIANIYGISSDYLLGLIDTPNHSLQYSITEELTLNESEVKTIKYMKESFLEEISANPEANVESLKRYWEFIKNEKNEK